jgi:hypothetical protein
MKKYQILFIISILVILFSGCSDDDGKDPVLSGTFLKQTRWAGSMKKIVSGEVYSDDRVTFYFTTENRGSHDFSNRPLYAFQRDFTYTIDDKVLIIEGREEVNTTGDWILLHITDNTLSFRKDLTNDYNYCTLELRKVPENNRPSGRY